MKHLLSIIFAAVVILAAAGALQAQESEFCQTKVTPPSGNNCSGDDLSAAIFSWNTEADGTVSVEITGLPGNTETAFRGGTGMNAVNLKVTGKDNITFAGAFTNDSKTKIIFTPNQNLAEGDVLTYNALVEYKTANAPARGFALQDLWPTLSFTHTFGYTCVPPEPQPLATPSDISITGENVITFTADINAARTTLTVYRGNSMLPVHIQDVNSSDVVLFSLAGDYTVALQSFSNSLLYLNSAVSERVLWVINGTAPVVNVGETVFCNTSKGAGDAEALFTWETLDGKLVIKIAPVEIGADGTNFRAAMGVANFTVNGFRGTWFENGILSEGNTVITYNPLVPLLNGDTIHYNAMVEYATAGNGNLYPNINFDGYIWGSRCPQAEVLSPPSNIAVNNGVLTFSAVENALSYRLVVYRGQSQLKEYEAMLNSTTDTLLLNVPDNYTLTLRSIGDNIDYMSSDESPRYAFEYTNPLYREVQPGVSTFCGFEFDPLPNSNGNNDRVAFSWETINGNIVATIGNAEGNSGTFFRANGLFAENLYVNGQHNSDFFISQLSDNNTKVILTPNITLHVGDRIVYNGIIEYYTEQVLDADSNPVGLWSTVNFGNYGTYLYGSTCENASSVNVSTKRLFFTPDTGVRTFTVSGYNFTEPIVVTAPYGLTVQRPRESSVEPTRTDTLYPFSSGVLPTTLIEVRWYEGSSADGKIRIQGGGMPFAKEIDIVSDGFSDYCNKVLNFQAEGLGSCPVYLSISHPDANVMQFELHPVYDTVARWSASNNSIQVEKVNTSRVGLTVTSRQQNENIITLTFSEALLENDTIKIGPNPAFVWEAANENGAVHYNCFIDAVQTYIVGKTCSLHNEHPPVLTEIKDVVYNGQSFNDGTVKITVQSGTYPAAAVRIWESEDRVPFVQHTLSQNSIYAVTGLQPYNTYIFSVQAADEKGYGSTIKKFTVKNLGVLSADSVSLADTVIFDGQPHSAQLVFPDGVGDSITVFYNGILDLPVQTGAYDITVSINEGLKYQKTTELFIGTMHIVRGSMTERMFYHSADTAVYDGLPHSASVSIKEDVIGAGSITAIKYNGDTSLPVNAGIYAVSVDASEGESFNVTSNLVIDTLVILRAEPTIELIAFETDTFYTYNAQPHTVIAAPSPGVIGLGDITLKYNGVAQAINVGEYTVTASVAQGLNYNAANNFVLPVTIIINKAVLAAEHFSFPLMTPLQDEGSTEVPVTLATPYTGAGIITVKYNGNVSPPTEAGRYLLSVSVTEGSNFFATEDDIVLDSVLISKTHNVTVRVVNEKMFLMLSPAFTVVATGFILNDSVVTTGGKAVFENVVHGSQITVNAFAAGYEDVYEVAETTFPAIMQDTTVEIVAIMKTNSIDPLQNGGNNKTAAYISDGVLFVKTSERYNSVSLYNVTGTKVYTSKAWKECYNLPSLPPGIYIVVFERSGRGIWQKNETVKVLKTYI